MLTLTKKTFFFVDAILMQVIWVAGVIYQDSGLPYALLAIVSHFLLSPEPRQDALIALRFAPVGIALDYGLMQSGVFVFPLSTFPLWLALLWVGFAMTLRHSLGWLIQRPIWVQALFGAIGGTLSYCSGVKFDAVSFGVATEVAVVTLAVLWAFAMPLGCRLSRLNQERTTASSP